MKRNLIMIERELAPTDSYKFFLKSIHKENKIKGGALRWSRHASPFGICVIMSSLLPQATDRNSCC